MIETVDGIDSLLVTPELFGVRIGKPATAIRKMAAAGKLPVVRMWPGAVGVGKPEIYIHMGEWNEYAEHLSRTASPEWHEWKNRLGTNTAFSGRVKKNASLAG